MSIRPRPIHTPATPRNTAGPVRLSAFLTAAAPVAPTSVARPYPITQPVPLQHQKQRRLS
ncbi:hypothetical protein [Zoogloea sp. 1C4]|uniref:hypothetical protein n=1 Tax=Zoogloea sp. 1C4 TaxID=2570190 RepID=UPI001290B753|nr:hypothetical protein [Zoogloea sp. 1C4]